MALLDLVKEIVKNEAEGDLSPEQINAIAEKILASSEAEVLKSKYNLE